MDCSHAASEKNRLIATTFCLEKESSCCICLQPMFTKPVIYLPCKHFLHTNCLKETVKSGLQTCPLCRRDHTTAYMKVRFLTEDILKQKEAARQEAQRLANENYILTLLMGELEEDHMMFLLMQPGLNMQLLNQMHVFWQDDVEDDGVGAEDDGVGAENDVVVADEDAAAEDADEDDMQDDAANVSFF